LGLLVASVICVSAASIISSKNITYTNANSNATNVEDALNDLYDDFNNNTCLLTKDFDYTGTEQIYVAKRNGYYKIEAWGAQGGEAKVSSGTVFKGGYGAYSIGIVNLNAYTNIYVNVGGSGETAYLSSGVHKGGYNGGGNSYLTAYASGGGATHFATTPGLLSSLVDNKDSILLVSAGGGASCADPMGGGYCIAGSGGGISGVNASAGSSGYGSAGYGATQTTGYAFGQGFDANGTDKSGGAGGYYGSARSPGSASWASCTGGGSSYIGNSLLLSSSTITKHMTCYNCQTSTVAATMTNTTTNVSALAIADNAKSGNGYARITYLGMTLN